MSDLNTNGYLDGTLSRRLDSIPLLKFDSSITVPAPTGLATFRLNFQNLSNVMNVQVAVSIIGKEGSAVRPATGLTSESGDYPASPGLIQILPVTNYHDASKGYGRPVFQDPTATDNANNPLPATIPIFWNAAAESDEMEIEIQIDLSKYVGADIDGTLTAQAMVTWDGSWWDIAAIAKAFSKVTFMGGPKTPAIVATGVVS